MIVQPFIEVLSFGHINKMYINIFHEFRIEELKPIGGTATLYYIDGCIAWHRTLSIPDARKVKVYHAFDS